MPGQIIPKTLHIDRRAGQIIQSPAAAGEPDDLLTTQQIADWFGIAKGTLELARHKGFGSPPFIRLFGRVRYRRSAVVAWLQERQHTGTAEYRVAQPNGADTDTGNGADTSAPATNRALRRQMAHNVRNGRTPVHGFKRGN